MDEQVILGRISRNVELLMAAKRLSQADVGLILGVTQGAVSSRLRGIKAWDFHDLCLLARAWGYDNPLVLTGPVESLGLDRLDPTLRPARRAGKRGSLPEQARKARTSAPLIAA